MTQETQTFELPSALVEEFTELCTHYPEKRAALIPALHRCQEELGGWLSPDTMEAVAAFFGLEPVEVFGVASFYPMFHLKPRGKHLISVCHNISCDLRGAEDIRAAAREATRCEVGQVSEDGEYYLEVLECQGACASAPMLDLDGVYHENIAPEDVRRILEGAKANAKIDTRDTLIFKGYW